MRDERPRRGLATWPRWSDRGVRRMTHTHHANMGRCTQCETPPGRTTDMTDKTNPTEIVAEAVREYVGDGDGADKEILAAYERQIHDQIGAQVAAQAWDEGHRTPWKREMDDCQCSAWSSSECVCGKYGTGKLITSNPYRKELP